MTFATCLLALTVAEAAAAHAQYRPFSLNRYLLVDFEAETIRLSYDVTVGDIPAREMRIRADDDRDGLLSENELDSIRRWMQGLLETGFRLSLDNRPAQLAWRAAVEWGSPEVTLFSPMRLRFRAVLSCPAGRHSLLIRDEAKFPSLEQTELLVAAGPFGENLEVRRARTRENQPHIFWEQGQPPEPVEVRLLMRREPAAAAATTPSPPELRDEMSPLKRALAERGLGFLGWLGAVALALVLGAVHALSPGHGKTLVAAFLLGSSARIRHAVVLGLTVTLAHVASVVALGLVALWAAEKVLPERLAPWLEFASGALVLLLGGGMLLRRVLDRLHHAEPHHHHHHHGDHDHHHHCHPLAAPLPLSSDAGAPVRWRELLALGLSGGMVPCPSALVVLLFAVYCGRIGQGLLLIAAFSLGLSLTLVGVAILAVCARRLFLRWLSAGRSSRAAGWLPIASSACVMCIGGVLVAVALGSIG